MKTSKKTILKKACGKGGCGKGGPVGDAIKGAVQKAKNVGWDAMDVVERGHIVKDGTREIPMKYQPQFVKDMHLKALPETIGRKVGGAVGKAAGFAVGAMANPVGTAIKGVSSMIAPPKKALLQQAVRTASPANALINKAAPAKLKPVPVWAPQKGIPDQSKVKNIGVGWGGEKPR